MEALTRLTFAFSLLLIPVSLWETWKSEIAPRSVEDCEAKLNVFGSQSCCSLNFEASFRNLTTIQLGLFVLGVLRNSLNKKYEPNCIGRHGPIGQESYDIDSEAAVDHSLGNRLWTYSLQRLMDLMTTLARIDPMITQNVDDQAMMTNAIMTIIHRSELLCIDVASSICEKPHPRARDLGTKRTCEQCLEGNARPERRDDGVINICTKCIQLGILCLIIVSNRSVLRVTASSSLLNFHQLFLYLSYRGDLRYCLYFKYRFFYNLYKVQTMEVSYYVFLLDKNGSILE